MVERLERQQKAGETLSPFLKRVLHAAAREGRINGQGIVDAAKRVVRRDDAAEKTGSE